MVNISICHNIFSYSFLTIEESCVEVEGSRKQIQKCFTLEKAAEFYCAWPCIKAATIGLENDNIIVIAGKILIFIFIAGQVIYGDKDSIMKHTGLDAISREIAIAGNVWGADANLSNSERATFDI